MVNIDRIRSAQIKVKQAREQLLRAFGEWDEHVIAMHTAWIAVRRAEKVVREAENLLTATLEEVDNGSASMSQR